MATSQKAELMSQAADIDIQLLTALSDKVARRKAELGEEFVKIFEWSIKEALPKWINPFSVEANLASAIESLDSAEDLLATIRRMGIEPSLIVDNKKYEYINNDSTGIPSYESVMQSLKNRFKHKLNYLVVYVKAVAIGRCIVFKTSDAYDLSQLLESLSKGGIGSIRDWLRCVVDEHKQFSLNSSEIAHVLPLSVTKRKDAPNNRLFIRALDAGLAQDPGIDTIPGAEFKNKLKLKFNLKDFAGIVEGKNRLRRFGLQIVNVTELGGNVPPKFQRVSISGSGIDLDLYRQGIWDLGSCSAYAPSSHRPFDCAWLVSERFINIDACREWTLTFESPLQTDDLADFILYVVVEETP